MLEVGELFIAKKSFPLVYRTNIRVFFGKMLKQRIHYLSILILADAMSMS